MSLLPYLVSGVAGWLTYEQMRGQQIHHDEHDLYEPIKTIAEARDYRVWKQFPLPRTSAGVGAPKQIDFVLGANDASEFLVLEVKFKRTMKEMAGAIYKDALKIRDVDADTINEVATARRRRFPTCQSAQSIKHAVLFVWHEGAVLGHLKKEKRPIQKQMVKLFKYMLADPGAASGDEIRKAFAGDVPVRSVSRSWGHIRFAATHTHKRYWVAALPKTDEWEDID